MLAAIQLAAGEFLPVQAPVEQLEPTQFVNFDTDSLETTSSDCVDGVNVALQKASKCSTKKGGHDTRHSPLPRVNLRDDHHLE